MEITENSFIEEQLSQVQSSASSKSEFMFFLQGLKVVVSDLIDSPFGGKYNIITQSSDTETSGLFNTQDKRNFLMFLGYIEEADQFVYNPSDENMSKLVDCLQILERQCDMQKQTILCELNGNYNQRKLERLEEKGRRCKASEFLSGLKEVFLLKHMKKAETDNTMVVGKKNSGKSSDFAFNTSGYFHQSSNSNTTRAAKKSKRCFISDLFHKQDHNSVGYSSLGCGVKLI